jgi:ribosome-associated protein
MKSNASSKDLALACAKAAIDKKASHSIIFDVGKLGAFTDYFLITSGTNERQVQAIADELFRLSKEWGCGSPRLEGYDEGRWVLVDMGGVVVHVFHDYIREFYDLETLWADAPRLSIPEEYYTSRSEMNSSPTAIAAHN